MDLEHARPPAISSKTGYLVPNIVLSSMRVWGSGSLGVLRHSGVVGGSGSAEG